MDGTYDVIVAGGGPAGASCAAFCARAGLRVLVVERSAFPREKVCGDCLNPACGPVLERLGVAERVRALPHEELRVVEFISARGTRVEFPLPQGLDGEIAVRRSLFDALLLENAMAAGAQVLTRTAATGIETMPGASGGGFRVRLQADGAAPPPESARWKEARLVIAADGRNSLIARSAGLLPAETRAARDGRVGLQAHVPCPSAYQARVQMRWFASGYGGLAAVGGGVLNISLAGPAAAIPELKRWANDEFALGGGESWRTIAPVDRLPARQVATDAGVFLTGDAARVVEPFTGEGIYYALRSGELAAEAAARVCKGGWAVARAAAGYRTAHSAMYGGRLWVNRLARAAVLRPRLASALIEAARWQPGILRLLTAKVVRGA